MSSWPWLRAGDKAKTYNETADFAHGSMRAPGAKKESNEVELSRLLTDRGKATRLLARPRPKHCPGYAGQLVGERDRQHVVVQPPLGRFDPRFEPVAFPAFRFHQSDPGCLDEQDGPK
jgi:hypothetical protein